MVTAWAKTIVGVTPVPMGACLLCQAHGQRRTANRCRVVPDSVTQACRVWPEALWVLNRSQGTKSLVINEFVAPTTGRAPTVGGEPQFPDSYEEGPISMEEKDTTERLHALEVAQATQEATLAGAQATEAATQAGLASSTTVAHAGTIATMAVGSVALIVGIFLGIVIGRE